MLVPSQHEAARDRREDAGCADIFACDIACPGGQEADGNFKMGVAEAAEHPDHPEPDGDAHRDPSGRDIDERHRRYPGVEAARQSGGHREAEKNEAGSVVH